MLIKNVAQFPWISPINASINYSNYTTSWSWWNSWQRIWRGEVKEKRMICVTQNNEKVTSSMNSSEQSEPHFYTYTDNTLNENTAHKARTQHTKLFIVPFPVHPRYPRSFRVLFKLKPDEVGVCQTIQPDAYSHTKRGCCKVANNHSLPPPPPIICPPRRYLSCNILRE